MGASTRRGLMRDLLRLLRPHQWTKNLVVLVGPLLGQRLDSGAAWLTAVVFAAFCLVASAGYVVNDLVDREADARHPTKRHRPLASGAVGPASALALAAVLTVVALALSWALLPVTCFVTVAAYGVLILAYTFTLKKRIIIDVIVIASGFVLRAAAGAAAVDVTASQWLLVCTFTLCLFLGFGKRRCELAAFDDAEEARRHRPTLAGYTAELLDGLLSVSAGIAVVTFLLYTMDHDPTTAPPFHKHHLLFSTPLVVYGVFRYAMLVQRGERHGPTDVILHDRPMALTVLLWSLFVAVVIWERPLLEVLGLGRLYGHG